MACVDSGEICKHVRLARWFGRRKTEDSGDIKASFKSFGKEVIFFQEGKVGEKKGGIMGMGMGDFMGPYIPLPIGVD